MSGCLSFGEYFFQDTDLGVLDSFSGLPFNLGAQHKWPCQLLVQMKPFVGSQFCYKCQPPNSGTNCSPLV